MKALCDMDTIQIELTNACVNSCSNCTRFCGHRTPFFLSLEQFQAAVDSLAGFPKMVGFMGGEPLLHPQFFEFCLYAKEKIPKERLGLWTCLPKGFEHYRTTICETFDHIFINDHSRNDIHHAPILVGAEEVFKDPREMFYCIDHCWLQNSWSASINPKGAFFCEIAASMSMLFDGPEGWKVEPGWWWRIPKDFTSQIEEYCPKCGVALPFARRSSTEGLDDISPKNLERLRGKSHKVTRGAFVLSNLQLVNTPAPMAAYKDLEWRNQISARYGIFQFVNSQHFLTPVLFKNWTPPNTGEKEEENASKEGNL